MNIAGIDITTETQWAGSIIIIGFGVWRTYLNPLKRKVYSLDREMGEVKTDVASLKSNVANLKSDMSAVQKDISVIRADMSLIKGYVLKTR